MNDLWLGEINLYGCFVMWSPDLLHLDGLFRYHHSHNVIEQTLCLYLINSQSAFLNIVIININISVNFNSYSMNIQIAKEI